MAYNIYTQSFGPAYANAEVRIFNASTGAPATILATTSGGIVNRRGAASLDSSGNLSVIIDTAFSYTFNVIDAQPGYTEPLYAKTEPETGWTQIVNFKGDRKVDGGIVNIAAALTITPANAINYDGKTLIFASAQTVTLSAGLPAGFSIVCRPPASGNASIASDGVVQLDGATTTVTRALSGNKLFCVAYLGTNTYTVTGA